MPETERVLTAGEWTARVSAFGASLRGATWRGETVVTGYSGRENKQGGQGDVLIPFPGRIGGGVYDWDGQKYSLERSDKDGPNAIHGFFRNQLWDEVEVREDQVTYAVAIEGARGYPFPLLAAICYRLDAETGLTCEFGITNAGETDAPVAAGFHPYFTVGSELVNDDELELPFASVLEFENFIPTGKVLSCAEAGLDFYSPKNIGDTVFNHCFLNPEPDCDGATGVKLRNSQRTVRVWMDKSFPFVVIYTGENLPENLRRRSLAIEPMTCGSDAFNHPEWGLVRLKPGEQLAGSWGVSVSPR